MVESKIVSKINGVDVVEYTLKDKDLEVTILNLGATVKSIKYCGVDVTLGYPDPQEYLDYKAYVGAIVGRTANRIGKSEFTLNDNTYHITANEGRNNLHGGIEGFHRHFFECSIVDGALVCKMTSPDGEEGYPGTLLFEVKYEICDNELVMEFKATSDKDTVWAPTAHIYFNMNGENAGDATGNFLKIYADNYTPVDNELIPLGYNADVTGTVFDFRNGKTINADFDKINGYDHNFVLNGEHVLTMTGPDTGIVMDMYSDMPGVQMYSGIASMGGVQGLSKKYYAQEGIALEPQFVPNAINMDGFKKPILKAGSEEKHYIKLAFSKKVN